MASVLTYNPLGMACLGFDRFDIYSDSYMRNDPTFHIPYDTRKRSKHIRPYSLCGSEQTRGVYCY